MNRLGPYFLIYFTCTRNTLDSDSKSNHPLCLIIGVSVCLLIYWSVNTIPSITVSCVTTLTHIPRHTRTSTPPVPLPVLQQEIRPGISYPFPIGSGFFIFNYLIYLMYGLEQGTRDVYNNRLSMI